MLKRRFHGVQGVFSSLNAFKSLMFYSTSTLTAQEYSPVPEYLVKWLGFSQEEAVSLCSKVSSPFKSSKKPQLVIVFLQDIGFTDSHIKKLIQSYPKVLASDIDNTLKPKIRVFQELGLSGSDLGTLMSNQSHIFSRGLETHIIPALDNLKSVFSSHEILVKTLLKTQWLLSSNTCKYLKANVALLRGYGVPMEKIESFMATTPRLLLHRPEWLQHAANSSEEKLGIHRTSGMFLHGVCVMSSVNEERFETRVGTFRDFGWTESDISVLIKRHPYCLKVTEERMRRKLKYFMGELGFEPSYLATHGTLLLFSIEKRIVPRIFVMEILKKKQLLKSSTCLVTMVKPNEPDFLKRYVAPYKDEVPQLHKNYLKSKKGEPLKH